MLENECHPGECTLEKIPPFAYELRVEADGYLDYTEDLDIKSNSQIERSIQLERNITLGEYHTKEASAKIARKTLSAAIESASGMIVG